MMHRILLIVLLLALGACAEPYDLSTPEGRYRDARARQIMMQSWDFGTVCTRAGRAVICQ